MRAPAKCWQAEAECMPREDLDELRLERLEATLSRVYRQVPFYQRAFDAAGFDPDELRSLDDLRRVPFTTREDLVAHQPYGLFAVPLREVVRLHAATGGAAHAAVIGYTRNDIKTWSNLVARDLVAAGVTKDDVVQIAFEYGLFTGALGIHDGAERLGASVIPASSGNARRQIRMMLDFKTTALAATPSYALALADTMDAMGVRRDALSLRRGLFGAEAWSEELRGALEARLGIVATYHYGVAEVMGPGVAGECLERRGLHLAEDHFAVEVVDPRTLEPVRPGERGELVLTTLTREAFPVIRYRTRELTRLVDEPCPCGRSSRRMLPPDGRSDDAVVVRGMTVFPAQVDAVLREAEGVEPHWQIVVERRGALDEATVLVEVSESNFFDEMKRQADLRARIEHRLASELGVALAVRFVQPRTIERGRQVVDRRA
jgi:phenylacetate-CoA ligase